MNKFTEVIVHSNDVSQVMSIHFQILKGTTI